MSTIQEIENAVSQLSREQLENFDAWYAEFKAQVWDNQITTDAAAGHLDELANEALQDYRAGRTRAL